MVAKSNMAKMGAAFFVAFVACACQMKSEDRQKRPVRTITLKLNAKPIRDISASSSCPILGYAGAGVGGGEDSKWLFETHRKEAAAVFRKCGARFVRQWDAVRQWRQGAGARMLWSKKLGKMENRHPEMTTDMKNAFSFYKEYGIKVMLTLENYGVITNNVTGAGTSDIEYVKKEICEYVQWIVDNDFKEVVAGFELGNEPYWMGHAMYTNEGCSPERYAERWCAIVPEIKKIFPECKIGMPLAEYFSADPDIAAVRARTDQAEKLEANGYFDASSMNQWSARFIKAMKSQLHNVSHVIYHSYGADAPFSATYWGIRRYRLFTEAFPELKGKKFWITEWRDRSDEEVPSHMRFRETLNKSAYMLMMVAQSDVDGMNLHEFRCQTGSMVWSFWNDKAKTGSWSVQWMNGGPDRPDYDSVGESRVYVGSMGPAMQLMVESLRRNPLVMDFGSDNYGSYSEGCSNAVWACSDYYASVIDYRTGIRKGLASEKMPKIKGDCQYLITCDKGKNIWALHCVNMNPHDVDFDIEFDGYCNPGAPDIRVTCCEERFADAHEIAGTARLSREYAYQPYAVEAGKYRITIPGNSVTTVTIPVRRGGMHSAALRILTAAVVHDEPFSSHPECGADQKPEDYHHYGVPRRYARLVMHKNGHLECNTSVGDLVDGSALKIFKIEDKEKKISAVLETDIEDAAILKELKKDVTKLCGVDFE